MAREKTIPYEDVRRVVDQPKYWPRGMLFRWKSRSPKRMPKPMTFRTPLAIDEAQTRFAESCFVELYFKNSHILGVPPTISMSLVIDNARTIAIDDNGKGKHLNKVGAGMPYHMERIGFPHIHIPIIESSYGYAEPLEPGSVQVFWELFLRESNIIGAPRIDLPMSGQSELNL